MGRLAGLHCFRIRVQSARRAIESATGPVSVYAEDAPELRAWILWVLLKEAGVNLFGEFNDGLAREFLEWAKADLRARILLGGVLENRCGFSRQANVAFLFVRPLMIWTATVFLALTPRELRPPALDRMSQHRTLLRTTHLCQAAFNPGLRNSETPECVVRTMNDAHRALIIRTLRQTNIGINHARG
jgi:hypothetical protein